MCNEGGSQCVKEKPKNNYKVNFVCVAICELFTSLFANHSLSILTGGRLVVPEAQVDTFGQNHMPPVPGSFEDAATGKTIHFWTKPIAWLLEVSVSMYAQEKKIAMDKAALGHLKSIDVVLGGNHGQGKF
jgi:hypothetical protein